MKLKKTIRLLDIEKENKVFFLSKLFKSIDYFKIFDIELKNNLRDYCFSENNNYLFNFNNKFKRVGISQNKIYIINADYNGIYQMISSLRNIEYIPISLYYNNILIKKQIKNNNLAVYMKNSNLVLFDGEEELPILFVNFLDKDKNIIYKYLLIIVIAYIYKIPLFIIRSFLCEIRDDKSE